MLQSAGTWQVDRLLQLTKADFADFRPDYKKLGTLKTLFPNVPIQAVVSKVPDSRAKLTATLDRYFEHKDDAGPAQDPKAAANL